MSKFKKDEWYIFFDDYIKKIYVFRVLGVGNQIVFFESINGELETVDPQEETTVAAFEKDSIIYNKSTLLKDSGTYFNSSKKSQSLPDSKEVKYAMLKRKTKFIDSMSKYSSRKMAYKKGWNDCYNWMCSFLTA